MVIVGVDCAVDKRNIGLALGEAGDDSAVIHEACTGNGINVAGKIAAWLSGVGPALLCIDAPLGWPAALGRELKSHHAGNPLNAPPEQLFTRETDRVIRQNTGKRPLDVGANLIARTAYAALTLLQQLRENTGQEIPLAWNPQSVSRFQAIEVYPAATLEVRGISSKGYKRKSAADIRLGIAAQLAKEISTTAVVERIRSSDHVFDAVLCVLAGADFLSGECILPANLDIAQREGWIWVMDPHLVKQETRG